MVKYLPYTLTLRAPAILNAAGRGSTSAATMDYIPGSAIRGALAARLGDPDTQEEIRPEFQTLVLDGSVRYLHAYPLNRLDRRRTLPALLSLRSSRDSDTCYDLAAFEGESQETWPKESLSPLSWHYVLITAAEPVGVNAEIGSRIHHQRDRQRGRAWTERQNGREIPHGTLFSYEFLKPGQSFGGFIQVFGADEQQCEQRINRIKEILSVPIHLGRSRRAGYGG
ncbi:MAG: hypothetical protein NZV14_11645, partial [Bryobacteraceae bacterium]|nr:hypothetical protein [Bryobacteraceae bacterium]MDW8378807.1 hypothetical protein [Bryobacterales bacterium]